MSKSYLITVSLIISLLLIGCSRKHHPGRTIENSSTTVKNNDSLAVKKVIKPRPKVPTPKFILVNDNVASKSVDGRLYYDLLGHRYWKNYKDGKYYLFNKSMYSNDAFKPK